jgi:hypothetical protein
VLAVGGNLEKLGMAKAAIDAYRRVVITYPKSASAKDAIARLKALKGAVPDISEYRPADDQEIVVEPLGSKRQRTAAAVEAPSAAADVPAKSVPAVSLPAVHLRSRSRSGSGDKSVTVRSYTRKDGTHVKSHTRSAPRRK